MLYFMKCGLRSTESEIDGEKMSASAKTLIDLCGSFCLNLKIPIATHSAFFVQLNEIVAFLMTISEIKKCDSYHCGNW